MIGTPGPISDTQLRPVVAATGLAPGRVSDWLDWAGRELNAHSDSARADAEFLLAALLGLARSDLAARADDALEAATVLRYTSWIERRRQGEPVAYITGRQGFWTLDLIVDSSVLIPRPDTETLVEWALAILDSSFPSAPHILDLGTGSGAIALALAQARPDARLIATDVSAEALELARQNAGALGIGNVEFRLGSWFEGLLESALPPEEGWVKDSQARINFDLIVSNPPYIAEADRHLAALRYEPRLALTSGANGLDALREIIGGAPGHLGSGGWLLLEHGHDQGEAVRALLATAGFTGLATRRDFGGNERVSGGHRP